MKIGTCFSNWYEFTSKFYAYCQQTFHIFVKDDFKTAASANKTRTRKLLDGFDIKYYKSEANVWVDCTQLAL